MEKNKIKGTGYRLSIVFGVFFFAVAALTLNGCKRQEDLSYMVQTRYNLMFDQLKNDTSLSIAVLALQRSKKQVFNSLTKQTDTVLLSSTLNAYGPYTFFAPDNNAFRKFFINQGKSSLADFTDSALFVIMDYHILPTGLAASSFIQGPQTVTTGSGDFISIDISKGYKSTAVANGIANIYQTDITYYNGFVHKIDAVLNPPVLTIGQFLQTYPDRYSIFVGGLKRANLMDTLINLTNASGIRTRLTLFAETNDVLQKAGITNFDNLSLDSVTRLMRDHLITGVNSSSSYTRRTTAIPSIGLIERYDSTILSIDGQDWIYFNLAGTHLIDSTTDFTASDVGMRNGILHNVSLPLAFPDSKKKTQIYHLFWSAANYCYGIPGFSNGNSTPVANASSGVWRYYYDGTAIPADGSIVTNLLYCQPDGVNDSLVSVVKNIRKGTYKFSINGKNGSRGTFQLYYGQDKIGVPVNYSFTGLAAYRQNYTIGTYTFKTSGDKRLNWVCTAVGGINLDCMVLTPQ